MNPGEIFDKGFDSGIKSAINIIKEVFEEWDFEDCECMEIIKEELIGKLGGKL